MLFRSLSRITNGEAPMGVNDDLLDATLFMIEIAPRWAENILEILLITTSWPKEDPMQTIAHLKEFELYTLILGRLYRQGGDQVL